MSREIVVPFNPDVTFSIDHTSSVVPPGGYVWFGGQPNTRLSIESVVVLGAGCHASEILVPDYERVGEFKRYKIVEGGRIEGEPKIDPSISPYIRVRNNSDKPSKAHVIASGVMPLDFGSFGDYTPSDMVPLTQDVDLLVRRPHGRQPLPGVEHRRENPRHPAIDAQQHRKYDAVFAMWPIAEPKREQCRMVLPPGKSEFTSRPQHRIRVVALQMRTDSELDVVIHGIQFANVNSFIGVQVPADFFRERRSFRSPTLDLANRMTLNFFNESDKDRYVEVDLIVDAEDRPTSTGN